MKLDRQDMKDIADSFLRIKALSEATVFMDSLSNFVDPQTKLAAQAKIAVEQSLRGEIGEAWGNIFRIMQARTHAACVAGEEYGNDPQEASRSDESRNIETSERP